MIKRREIGWVEHIKRFMVKIGLIDSVKKYVLCPETVGGKKNGFFALSKDLAFCYNVEMSECLVRIFPFREHPNEEKLLPLHYRKDGDYRKFPRKQVVK